jgi:hypothetical protein
MLENIKGSHNRCLKDYKTIYTFQKQGIVKQDESDGDSKFTTTTGFKENQQVIENHKLVGCHKNQTRGLT